MPTPEGRRRLDIDIAHDYYVRLLKLRARLEQELERRVSLTETIDIAIQRALEN